MMFRPKVDAFYINLMIIVILTIGLVSFLPLGLDEGVKLPAILKSVSLFLVMAGFILWCCCTVKYVFHQNYLLIKGGPFRSRISYQAITKVAPTKAILYGYRILTSKDGIEIFYKTAAFGSVKISPKNKSEFIAELKKRCSHLQIHGYGMDDA
ncbi:PH domain-containing protein [Amphibacillus sediminis]|uniref:PH domain-containing protein n=1 Tax=Amphibacillus sediminis TaxID=360185 RepID=UPI000830011F|nr:PH domain-containing protein [Amphibacillus sediminis]